MKTKRIIGLLAGLLVAAAVFDANAALPFNYAGCVVTDRSNSQVPRHWVASSNDMTIETCTSLAASKGYRYAGVEDSTQCFASTEIVGTTIDDKYCDYPCAGNNSEMCGSLFITSLYQDPSLPQ
jgi:hypothetical protein